MLDRIFNLLSSPPTRSDQTYDRSFDSTHSTAPTGANGRIHFDRCHPPQSCRRQPSCNVVLPQPAKKGGFLSKLFGGIGNALSNIFKPITSAISGIASFFSNLNPFKGLF